MPNKIHSENVMKDLAHLLKHGMEAMGLDSKTYGFTLIIFPFHKEPGTASANYISTAHREDSIEVLRETANHMEIELKEANKKGKY